MNAHSEKTCQCSSRTPPAVSRMLTPAIVSEIWKSACVTWRAQPPFWIRFGALLKDAQNCGMSPTSVGGGEDAAGNRSASAALGGTGAGHGPARCRSSCGPSELTPGKNRLNLVKESCRPHGQCCDENRHLGLK